MRRLAIIVSHPIQYYVPLYRRLAMRDDLAIRVFFTWHAAQVPMQDRGFGIPVAWDIPLTDGYEFESVPNVAADPGTHHFFGLQNPTLVERVKAWRPDAVHITGWAWESHLRAMRSFHRHGIPTLFGGDSHLLDLVDRGPQWWVKRQILRRVFSWPTECMYVGTANRAYYEAFDVDENRLLPCPHSIDVGRFSQPAEALEFEAAQWRRDLGIEETSRVLLFAGKFERKKRPADLMRAVQQHGDSGLILIMLGGGELQNEINAIATSDPGRFRVLPFENQARMPVVYRLGDLFVLPSAFGETWGLGVNEALACGRPVLVSDRVGCAADLIDPSYGRVFPWGDWAAAMRAVNEMGPSRDALIKMRSIAASRARSFDTSQSEAALMEGVRRACSS